MRPAFYAAADATLERSRGQLLQYPELRVIVGYPLQREGQRYNAAAVLRNGRVQGIYRKQDLPNYTVFDEQRYFTPGNAPCVFELAARAFGLIICEDIWFPEPRGAGAAAAGAQVLRRAQRLAVSHCGKQALRRAGHARARRETALPLVYVNRVGGQDELVFDGASFVVDARGRVAQQLPAWHEDSWRWPTSTACRSRAPCAASSIRRSSSTSTRR